MLYQSFKNLSKLVIFAETSSPMHVFFCQTVKIFRVLKKIRGIFHGPHRKFAWFVVISTSIFIILWTVGPGNTFVHWVRAGLEINRQEKIIEGYQKENAELDRRIDMMKHDRDTLEKFAREQYDFAISGEDVYVVE